MKNKTWIYIYRKYYYYYIFGPKVILNALFYYIYKIDIFSDMLLVILKKIGVFLTRFCYKYVIYLLWHIICNNK
jgi:hypothetical protein